MNYNVDSTFESMYFIIILGLQYEFYRLCDQFFYIFSIFFYITAHMHTKVSLMDIFYLFWMGCFKKNCYFFLEILLDIFIKFKNILAFKGSRENSLGWSSFPNLHFR